MTLLQRYTYGKSVVGVLKAKACYTADKKYDAQEIINAMQCTEISKPVCYVLLL